MSSSGSFARRRLVLVGAGHAHLGVLESLARQEWPAVDVTLVSPEPHQFYSGMVPGYLQGTYEESELTLDVGAVAARAGARFIAAAATSIDAPERRVHANGAALPFDLLSLDIGSVPGGLRCPGVEEHAFTLRPMRRALGLRRRVDELSKNAPRVRVAVVGAGAGGFEVALALHRRVRAHGSTPVVALVDRGSEILHGYAASARDRARALLASRGVDAVLDEEAISVDDGGVDLSSGARVDADLVVWSTGASAPALLSASALPLGPDGYLAVTPTLRARDGSPVWGAGDCVDVEGHDLPKAGVYAVRQGPVLARNLRSVLAGGGEEEYEPRSSFLSLLNTSDGRALLRWRSIVWHGRAAWWLKDRIDRRFVRRYRE